MFNIALVLYACKCKFWIVLTHACSGKKRAIRRWLFVYDAIFDAR